MYVASKILKSVLHNMQFIPVKCYVCQQTLSFLKNVKTECIESQKKKKMKTLWPKFDFDRIYSFKIDDDSEKIWPFSETDHTHFFEPKVRQIHQNFLWEPFWSSITPHKKL